MLQKLFKDSIVYGGSDFVLKLIAFFTFPILAATLSIQAFGALELIGTVIALTGFFSRCGLNNAVQRFYWDEDSLKQQKDIISTGLITLLVFSCMMALIGVISIPFLTNLVFDAGLPIGEVALYSVVGLILFSQSQQYMLDTLRLHFSPWKYFGFSLLTRIFITFAGLYAVVILNKGVDGFLLAQVIVSVLIFPIGLLFIKKDITFKINWKWAKTLLKFGSPFIFVDMAYWLFGSMDRWMLASMTTVDDVGIYSVASRFSMIVLFVSTAFGMAWSPYAIKLKTDYPDNYQKMYSEILLMLILLLIIVGGGVALFSGEIISLLMPEEYKASIIPLIILCSGIVIQTTQQITAVGISIEKKTYLFARMAWITAIVNLAANYFLIPEFGVAGAAWATLLSYTILTASYLFFTQRLHPIPIDYTRLFWLVILGVLVFVSAFTMSNYNLNIENVIYKILVFFILFLFSFFFTKMSVTKLSLLSNR